ncbi:MAG: NAD-dependent malic enzyme [Chloroflexi bacterium]|nr:NAD-dependent malic enzyme [Chloroflexota bacterium]
MELLPSASHSITMRCEIQNRPGMLGRITSAIGEEGGDIGAVDIVSVSKGVMLRDITFNARDEAHGRQVVERVKGLPGVRVVHTSDRTFLLHLGGKIEVRGKSPIKTRDDLSMAYTPGVARVCRAIAEDPSKAFALTIKRNAVAVVTDGSAVLGLGNIGHQAAQPVMEGKAMIFKEFGGVDAFPICLATQDPDEIVETVERIAPVFGGINLEDIAAPRCFEVEERLRERLDIPVFHDDQHGTAVVVLASLLNALKVVGKDLDKVRVVMMGAGAAGIATTRMLRAAGAWNIVVCDSVGAIYSGRPERMNPAKNWVAEQTNPGQFRGSVHQALAGADVFIGVSVPGIIAVDDIRSMARDPVVFAMANPWPEIQPEAVAGLVRVMATGRSDYPNQINNSLVFPGMFRGALDVQARTINEAMKMAAARAIADMVGEDELSEEYIVPSMFNRRVVESVSAAVAEAAHRTGVARRQRAGAEAALA